MERHSSRTVNDNGERLLSFSGLNDLVIGGILFPRKEIHKLMRYLSNISDRNQTDHIVINSRWRHSLQGMKVKEGADPGSNYHLVVATLKAQNNTKDI